MATPSVVPWNLSSSNRPAWRPGQSLYWAVLAFAFASTGCTEPSGGARSDEGGSSSSTSSSAKTGPSTGAEPPEDWAAHLSVSAAREGDTLRVTLEGVDGFYVNTGFPYAVSLEPGADVGALSLTPERLTHAQASLEGAQAEGKSERIVLEGELSGEGPVRVRYRTLVCTEALCSPPLEGVVEAT